MKKLASITKFLFMVLVFSSFLTFEANLNQDINSQGNNIKAMTETMPQISRQANQLVDQTGYPSIKRRQHEKNEGSSQNLIFAYQKSIIQETIIIIEGSKKKVGQKFAQQTFQPQNIVHTVQQSLSNISSTNLNSKKQQFTTLPSIQSSNAQLQAGKLTLQNNSIEADFNNITKEFKAKLLDEQPAGINSGSDGIQQMTKIKQQDKVQIMNNGSIEAKEMSYRDDNTPNATEIVMKPNDIYNNQSTISTSTLINANMSIMENTNSAIKRAIAENKTENVEQDLQKSANKLTSILGSFLDNSATEININFKNAASEPNSVSKNNQKESTTKIENRLPSDVNLNLPISPANNQHEDKVSKLTQIPKLIGNNNDNVSNISSSSLIAFSLHINNDTSRTNFTIFKDIVSNTSDKRINQKNDNFQNKNNQSDGRTKQMQGATPRMNTILNSSTTSNESSITKKQHNESTLQLNISLALNKTSMSQFIANSTATSIKQIAQKSLNISSLINMNERTIINRQFSGVGLYHDVPVSFMQGQLFRFSGVILNSSSLTFTGTAIYNSINVIFRQFGSLDQFRCTKQVVFGKYDFQLSCRIMRPGRFFLFVFPGASGLSSSKLRYVRGLELITPVIYFNIQQFKPERIALSVQDNRLIIKWDTLAPLTNLTISQKNLPKRQYLLSNYHKKFEVPFSQFKQFQSSIVKIEISHADSNDGSLSSINTPFSQDTATLQFQAIQHFHDKSEDGKYNITPSIPWRVASGEKFKFNAIFEQDIKNEVFITLPNGILAKVNFTRTLPANATIRARTPLQLQLTLIMPGPYIIQINAVTGIAIINRPIYVGEGFPLLPDNHDLISLQANQLSSLQKMTILQQYITKTTNLKEKRAEPSVSSSLNDKREYLLYLLNGLRTKYKADSVVIDEQLNKIAQFHSDDMAKNNYFGHNSLNGDQAKDRALKFNFTNTISQNIAKALTLIEAHLGLQRSASHLETSIKSEWTRVGIGISVDRQDYYIVVFEFSNRDLSTKPLAIQQLQNYRQQLIKLTLEKNLQLKQNSRISKYIGEWLPTSRNINLFQYLFSKQNLMMGSLSALSFSTSFSDNMIEVIRNARYLEGKYSAKQFGIAVQMKKGENSVEGYAVFL